MKIEMEPQEFEKLLDTIVALETRMEEWDVKSVNIKTGEVDYKKLYDKPKSGRYVWDDKKHKPLFHNCDDCAYSGLSLNDGPCYTCGIEEGRYDNWKERTEIE